MDRLEAVFFDLDGTLIDVDMRRFVPVYLRRLTERMKTFADPARATRALHDAVAAMFANQNPDRTLEMILMTNLQEKLALPADQYNSCLEAFAREDLDELRPLVKGHPLSQRLVDAALARKWTVVLATNPIFPRVVIDARLEWGQLDNHKFHHVTAYETAHFCKPNPAFFEELLVVAGVRADRSLMVGNDTIHDLAASRVGMQTCLLTPWRIRRPGSEFRADWQGRHEELLEMIETSPGEPNDSAGPD